MEQGIILNLVTLDQNLIETLFFFLVYFAQTMT